MRFSATVAAWFLASVVSQDLEPLLLSKIAQPTSIAIETHPTNAADRLLLGAKVIEIERKGSLAQDCACGLRNSRE